MSTRSSSPTPWTALTAVVLLLMVGSVVNLAFDSRWVRVVMFPVGCVFAYWIVAGCARRGEPLAQRLLGRWLTPE